MLSNSPAIDAGSSLSPYTDGYAGSAPDIGAYEYGITPWTVGAIITTNDSEPPTIPINVSATSLSTSQIALSWTESLDNVGIAGYKVFRSGLEVGTTSSTSYKDTSLSTSTSYNYTVQAYDFAENESAESAAVIATTDGAKLPGAWLNQDIGNVGIAGSASYNSSTNKINVQGSGADIYGTSDQFHYVYQPLSGDGEMVLRVTGLEFTHSSAKAGIMIRETLNTDSINAHVYIQPQGQVQYTSRLTTGGSSGYAVGTTSSFPHWLKLERTGNIIDVYQSSNGTAWTLISSESITMAAEVNIGMVALSHDDMKLTTASFDDITVKGNIIREYWTGVTGESIYDFPVNSSPSGTSILTSLEGPTDWDDNYATRIRGYITPTSTGSYIFNIAGDNDAELWLSTDGNPENKILIASVSGWTNPQEWNKYATQQSTAISLTAGLNYYVEVLHKEGTGGDNLAVGWTGPGFSTITVIDGSFLSPYSENDTEPPTAPTNLTSPSKTDTTVDLTWDASTDNVGVTQYYVYVDGVYNSSSTTTSHTVTGLTENTMYSFTVKAKDAADNASTSSNQMDVTTDETLVIRDALSTIEAESYDDMSGIVNYGTNIGSIDHGDWVKFNDVEFNASISTFKANIGVSEANAGQQIEIRTGGVNGPLAGTITVQSTGDFGNFEVQSTPVFGLTGIHDLYLVGNGSSGIGNIDWITFAEPVKREAESYDDMSGITNYGTNIGGFDHGDWIKYSAIQLGTGLNTFTANIGVSEENAGQQVEIRLGSVTGTLVGVLTVDNTGDFSTFVEQTIEVTGASGTQDVFLIGNGSSGIGNIDWISFQ